jgi:hypothetical protein
MKGRPVGNDITRNIGDDIVKQYEGCSNRDRIYTNSLNAGIAEPKHIRAKSLRHYGDLVMMKGDSVVFGTRLPKSEGLCGFQRGSNVIVG